MLISVVIPTVRSATLLDAVSSIARQTHPDWELIVVGQGDDPALQRALASSSAIDTRVKTVLLSKRGVSLARNAGIEQSSGSVVAFMDDDCEAREDWLETLSAIFESEPSVQLVGGTLLAPPPAQAGPSSCPHAEPAEILYDPIASGMQAPLQFLILTANMAVRRSAIEAIAGFDELLGPGAPFGAGEDPGFVLRLEAQGFLMGSTPRVVVRHTHGYRYGNKAAHQILRNYAVGQGALAAKLTMSGDARGRLWFRNVVTAVADDPRNVPKNVLRAVYFMRSYRACRRTTACTITDTWLL